MDKETFLALQYQTLRNEIEKCHDRAFQLMLGGAAVIPIIDNILRSHAGTPFQLLLPMTVIVIVLLYLHQRSSLMRCGRYIRLHIESEMEGLIGWEQWLESCADGRRGGDEPSRREVDHYISFAFLLVATGYYIIAVYIAAEYAFAHKGSVGLAVALAIYINVGFLVLVGVAPRVRATTRAANEPLILFSRTAGTDDAALVVAPPSP